MQLKTGRSCYAVCFFMLCISVAGCKRQSPPVANDAAADSTAAPAERTSSSGAIPAAPASGDAQQQHGGAATLKKTPASQPDGVLPYFELLGEEAGIDFVREDDIRGQRRIFESTGGGVGVIDWDSDGRLDVLFTGGCRLPLGEGPHEPTCGLFRNLGAARFANATSQSRLLQPGYCQGVAVGDFDNDGFDDVYIAAFGENALWHNCGDGTFEDVTAKSGTAVSSWSTSCAFADVDVDGNLDLYVVTYLNDSAESPLQCPNPRAPDGFEQCPPSKYEGLDDFLFLGDGQGGFRDASASAGIKGLAGKGLGIAICDFDQDSRPEIYVANDGEANFLLARKPSDDGGIAFEDQGMLAGVALSRSGYAQASMGVAAGDHDGNGTIDLFLTNFYGDSNTLYSNLGPLHFEDVTRRTGLSGPSRGVLGWGTVFVDFNHDGRLDLFVANGHVEDRRWNGQGEPYKMPPQVFRNEGGGRFSDVSQYAGEYFQSEWLGRGVAWGDFDRDGRVDLSVSHQLDRSCVLLNRTRDVEPLVTVRLIGIDSNRNGIGARIETLDEDGRTLAVRTMCGGTSFQSAMAGEAYLDSVGGKARTIRVTWPTGNSHEWPWQALDNGVVIVEAGQSLTQETQ